MFANNLLVILATLCLLSRAVDSPSEFNFSANTEKKETVRLHFLPHTSLEVGAFASTKEGYEHYVKKILKSLIEELTKNDELRFNWSDVAYLEMWWNDKHISTEQK